MEEGGDLRAYADGRHFLFAERVAEDVASFFFHASVVALGAVLEAGFELVFNISHKELSHRLITLAITIAWLLFWLTIRAAMPRVAATVSPTRLRDYLDERESIGMMKPSHGPDPLEKVRGESSRFNVAWLRDGKMLTLTQRIGFAVFSLFFFAAGLLFATYVLHDLLGGELLGAAGWLIPALVFVVPGLLGLRNVLRF